MSEDAFSFAPPPFKPGEALLQLRRSLRDLGLSERGDGFELRGRRVIEFAQQPESIDVKLARRPALSPEWEPRVLRSAADQRKLVDEIRKRLERWTREDT